MDYIKLIDDEINKVKEENEVFFTVQSVPTQTIKFVENCRVFHKKKTFNN